MSLLEVNKITPQSGTTLTLGDSGDTINFGSGVLPNFENLTVTGDLTVDTNSLKVDSTNNRVGIGTASPSVALDVVGAITATGNITGTLATASQPNITSVGTLTSATVSGDLTVGTDKLFVDVSASKVGIGTSSPQKTLHVIDEGAVNSKHVVLRVENSNTGDSPVGLEFITNRGSSAGSTKIYGQPENSSGTASIQYLGANHYFRNQGDTSTYMTINSSGNVGIGENTPDTMLHVKKASSGTETAFTNSVITLENDTDCRLQFLSGSSSVGEIMFGDGNLNRQGRFKYDHSSDAMIFETTNAERMRINSSGNVGIGTSSPDGSSFSGSSSPVLDVSGTRPLIILSETDSNTKKAWLGLSSDQFFVGGTNTDTLFYTNGGERMRIESNGDIFFKNTTESAINGGSTDGKFIDNADGCRLRSSRASTSTREHIIFYNPNGDVGDISTSGTSTSYNTSSDYRLKENVVEITGATERLKQLSPKRFNFIADADTTVDGFLAHEVSDIVPEAITGTHNEVQVWEEGEELPEGVSVGDNKLDDEGNTIPVYQGIDQSKLVPLLVATIKELEARIEALENA